MASNIAPLILFVIIIAVFYVIMVLPQQRRTREHQKLVDSVKPGTTVMTVGGIIGVVRGVAEDTMVLEVQPGVELTVARQAIARRLDEFDSDQVIVEDRENTPGHEEIDG